MLVSLWQVEKDHLLLELLILVLRDSKIVFWSGRNRHPSSFHVCIKGICVPGIGHRIKRGDKRDKRVELLQKFGRTHFPSVKYMEYAVQVKTYTLSKANNLVLNVDGAIGSLFLDLLSGSGMFTKQEIDEIVGIGYLNGLFVLARSIGLIGHTFDQKRLNQPLYRHPWEDVLYTK
ncbi:ATP-citrate synthase beta chain protein 1-like [Silene latifolia]|uniref:ATP-citrate synthase beta chain protein 1-like n=1 Tax=Silene latifolia TaxID=37657 RepID=UPI003D77E8F6